MHEGRDGSDEPPTLAMAGVDDLGRRGLLLHSLLSLLLFSAPVLSLGACAARPIQSPSTQHTPNRTTHFRGGIWDQLLYWILPGPDAFAAVAR